MYKKTTPTPTFSIFPSNQQLFHLENVQKWVMIKIMSSTRRNRWKRVGRDDLDVTRNAPKKWRYRRFAITLFTPRSLPYLWLRQDRRSFLARYSRSTIVPTHGQPCEWRRTPFSQWRFTALKWRSCLFEYKPPKPNDLIGVGDWRLWNAIERREYTSDRHLTSASNEFYVSMYTHGH